MNARLLAGLCVALLVGCGSPTVSPTPALRTPPQVGTIAPATSGAPPTAIQSVAPSSAGGSPTQPQASKTAGNSLIIALYASGFSGLTFATTDGGGPDVMYAVEQVGRIYLVTQGQSVPGEPWLDISERISSGGERGLLGLAFHPQFQSNGRFFVDYTNLAGDSVISEFTRAADGSVDPSAERVLLTVDQPFPNHNGGMLAFGADGDLYIGFGDGGSGGDPQGNGQSLKTLLGKILRIDVDKGDPYAIPTSNPFHPGNAQGAQPEIWDWGVRNPWRFSFDSSSAGMFIGDVGQDTTEEVDVERAGLGSRNYGWNLMEGDHCYAATTCNETGLTLPVATYGHDLGCAVTGGYVYRGARYPALVGRYFFADYCSSRVWTLDADAALAGQPVTAQVFGRVAFEVTSFGQDAAGELYIVDGSGAIYSLVAP